MAHDWALFSRDEDYRLTGGLPLSSFQGVIRHLGVDTAVIETPYTPDAYTRTGPGCGIVAQRDGRTEFSGLIASERTMGWDAQSGQPTIKVSCLGDNVHLKDRLTFPDPTRAGDQQTTKDYWTFSGAASSAMWQLIRDQAGPGALPDRRVPNMYMGADPGAGDVRPVWALLFDDVLHGCDLISVASGVDLGVRVVSTVDGLRADVYLPNDKAGNIRFSADLSNLVGFEYTETAPSVTYALVAGQGDLKARARASAISSSPLDLRWGRRIESYIDRRDEEDATVLAQAAADAVTEGQGQVSLSCTLTDSQAATYGRDWFLGDRVTVYVGLPGQTKAQIVTDVVREIFFDVANTGAETVRPAIGTTDAKALRPNPTQAALARVSENLQQLINRK